MVSACGEGWATRAQDQIVSQMIILEERRHELTGRCISAAEELLLASRLPFRIDWILALLHTYPLIGTKFVLKADQEPSGLGVNLAWMTPENTITESLDLYPGIAAVGLGYVAVGVCLRGSGDPYFVRALEGDDPPLVRIPHELLNADLSLSESVVEVVSPSLSVFFRNARFS